MPPNPIAVSNFWNFRSWLSTVILANHNHRINDKPTDANRKTGEAQGSREIERRVQSVAVRRLRERAMDFLSKESEAEGGELLGILCFLGNPFEIWIPISNILSLARANTHVHQAGLNGKIEDLFNKLEHLAKQKDIIGLRGGVITGKVSQRTSTTYVVEDGFCTYRRDGDKEKLKTVLLQSENEGSSNFFVVPVVGMGRVGKTTLTQLLYNDEQVKEHFDTNAWVCVSKQFEGLRVIKTLIEEITKNPCDILEMNPLEVQLREQLRGKRFLLILDDLWNENYDD
ncbi:putative disease resistance RPP13-like protein 1 [Malus sylvestris]|uniref:putative disease resistance RPP13-like protein 1 n=1 Tax=Malus sylvestris TaxID=3752 RepID=UPI0021AD421A|nr:putative disease resistance RPP13-like protein 1 [Malus sylvestris]